MAVVVFAGFINYPVFQPQQQSPNLKIAVIIAAKNEAAYIERCLQSIIEQIYPKELLEIILVDDASEDETYHLAEKTLSTSGISYRIIQNKTPLGKKQSLKLAIEASTSDFIVCTDADTFSYSNKWLSTIANYAEQTKKEFIICPVAIHHSNGVLSALQEIETSILNLFAIASVNCSAPFLCSGANMAFSKKMFYQTGAYSNHIHISSGDDVFFLEDVKQKSPEKIGYLKSKEALVYTYPEKTITALLHQKLRWSGKIFVSKNLINWLSALIITFANAIWLYAVFYTVNAPQNAGFALIFMLSKLLIDILLVFLAASFITVKASLPMVVLVGILYPIYALGVAVLAPIIKPKWKSD